MTIHDRTTTVVVEPYAQLVADVATTRDLDKATGLLTRALQISRGEALPSVDPEDRARFVTDLIREALELLERIARD